MFRTVFNIDPCPWKIKINSGVLSVGSCFAIHIGEHLRQNKFDAITNPFGTIFNPLSAFSLLEQSLSKHDPEQWTFTENQGVYRNLMFHSAIASLDKGDLNDQIKTAYWQCRDYLTNGDVLILTFGSAMVYEWKANGRIVSNCHKLPASYFNKRMLRTDEIVNEFSRTYNALKSVNSNLKIILTVSPVRHIKDTINLNSVSKSVLRIAAHDIENQFNDVYYFPSYELVMDDLRDYRFYNEDMVHPNNQAVNYVWERFMDVFLDRETKNFVNEWQDVLKALNHKPFYPQSDAHQKFLKKTIEKLVRLQKIVNVDKELTALKQQTNEGTSNQ